MASSPELVEAIVVASTAEQQAIALDREEVRQEGKSVGSQEVSIMTSPLFNIRVHLLGWKCPKNVRSVFNFSSQTCCTFFFAVSVLLSSCSVFGRAIFVFSDVPSKASRGKNSLNQHVEEKLLLTFGDVRCFDSF